MTDLVTVIGERIRNFRKERGLSQEELAFRASLHSTYIGQLERGEKNATIESFVKICTALDISLAELFEDNPDRPKVFSFELEKIISLLEDRSKKDQCAVLDIIESLLAWKDNE
ncbi:helix-turn-helix domain-containing protein [Ureibacillus sinduriensis]|uniref:XRE family transcriptional regulator n=1 Tax=Ureibacillus sinduriensis BLB-1 = JCM 15800 TaxID=1384057 RepID=A0A0A3HZQ3_9BACL|nr:helix-turn-helix transcriptional regulator [Ureibacillus sinduriensis]KGR75843.1 XRE family transcriptional regulator [Ureibacillus sinduriensis BLB-1 = JCM 15800]